MRERNRIPFVVTRVRVLGSGNTYLHQILTPRPETVAQSLWRGFKQNLAKNAEQIIWLTGIAAVGLLAGWLYVVPVLSGVVR